LSRKTTKMGKMVNRWEKKKVLRAIALQEEREKKRGKKKAGIRVKLIACHKKGKTI